MSVAKHCMSGANYAFPIEKLAKTTEMLTGPGRQRQCRRDPRAQCPLPRGPRLAAAPSLLPVGMSAPVNESVTKLYKNRGKLQDLDDNMFPGEGKYVQFNQRRLTRVNEHLPRNRVT